jgi:hypothetical protein
MKKKRNLMNKLLAILALTAGLSHATVIHWSASNDSKSLADAKANDGIYTGIVDLIEFNDGSVGSIWSTPDALLGKYVIMDASSNMFYISTSNAPGSIADNALFTASFNFDLNATNLTTSDGYLLGNIAINNSIGSAGLTDFAQTEALYPGATYTFSSQGAYGNGQLGTVPEPTSLGLMGLGLIGFGLFIRRKKTA